MNDNERIARWLGAKPIDHKRKYEDGALVLSGSTALQQVDPGLTDGTKAWKAWMPDKHITLWHGKDGILAEIEKKLGVNRWKFLLCLGLNNDWDAITVTPAQLTAALLKVIEEET